MERNPSVEYAKCDFCLQHGKCVTFDDREDYGRDSICTDCLAKWLEEASKLPDADHFPSIPVDECDHDYWQREWHYRPDGDASVLSVYELVCRKCGAIRDPPAPKSDPTKGANSVEIDEGGETKPWKVKYRDGGKFDPATAMQDLEQGRLEEQEATDVLEKLLTEKREQIAEERAK